MNDADIDDPLRFLLERIPGVCLIETDAGGILTRFGPAAERFFACPADEAVGRLHYRDFHDPGEMEACRDDPAFRAAMERDGWSEAVWRVIPRAGEPFDASVTLMHAAGDVSGERPGWIALYRRIFKG